MKAVRVKTHMTSETLTVNSPEFADLVGKEVEVIVIEEPAIDSAKTPTTGYGFMRRTILLDDDPFGPAVPPEDWEAAN